MAFLTVKNVSIRGVASCVPPKVEENVNLSIYKPGEAEEVMMFLKKGTCWILF